MAGGEQHASVGSGPRYGILGGTFDPPHLAHLVVAQDVVTRLGLDRVYFVPAGYPPHKTGYAVSTPGDRRAMVERAIAADARFALSAVDLDRPGPSYTVETLRRLRAAWGPTAALHFIVGGDTLLDLPDWYDPAGVVREATYIVAVHRPGYDPDPHQLEALAAALPELPAKLILVPVPQLDISASALRERVASSLPIRYLVPDSVVQYIAEHGLYRRAATPPGARPARESREGSGELAGDVGVLPELCAPGEEARP
jgi:nicotinate-nucleotide adenylyltransferase